MNTVYPVRLGVYKCGRGLGVSPGKQGKLVSLAWVLVSVQRPGCVSRALATISLAERGDPKASYTNETKRNQRTSFFSKVLANQRLGTIPETEAHFVDQLAPRGDRQLTLIGRINVREWLSGTGRDSIIPFSSNFPDPGWTELWSFAALLPGIMGRHLTVFECVLC